MPTHAHPLRAGVLSTSSLWLNGVRVAFSKQNGYLPLYLRLDTLPVALNYSAGGDNVLAVYADSQEATGWW